METNKLPKLLDWLAGGLLAAAALAAFFQFAPVPVTADGGAAAEVSAVRVEIQRYLGYEILPVRYLSLPYDLTMNTNVYLPILDTGILLLVFVPVVVLLGFWSKKQDAAPIVPTYEKWLLPLLVMLSCLLLLVLSTASGHLVGKEMNMVKPADIGPFLQDTPFSEFPTGVASAFFYQHFYHFYQAAIEPMLNRVSGNADAVTYPLLLALFGLFCYIAGRRFGQLGPSEKALVHFSLAYVFFWLLLSAGIVWYGLLAFPLLTVLVFRAFAGYGRAEDWLPKTGHYVFLGMAAASVLMGFAGRISNVNGRLPANDPLFGKRLFDPAYVRYLTGDFTEEKVYDAYYLGIGNALRSVNSEDKSLIYSVGTRFGFFIRANDKRIFKDNQLDFFNQIIQKHNTKTQVTALLKASGFRYIMVDLNTPTGDRTPEQSLVERYQKFLLLLYQNPGVQLLATNRQVKDPTGKGQPVFGVFGEVQKPGSYAIFEIK